MKKKSRGRPVIHPWDKWFSKRNGVLHRDVDYTCKTHGMVSQLRNYASNIGVPLSLKVHEDCIEYTLENN